MTTGFELTPDDDLLILATRKRAREQVRNSMTNGMIAGTTFNAITAKAYAWVLARLGSRLVRSHFLYMERMRVKERWLTRAKGVDIWVEIERSGNAEAIGKGAKTQQGHGTNALRKAQHSLERQNQIYESRGGQMLLNLDQAEIARVIEGANGR